MGSFLKNVGLILAAFTAILSTSGCSVEESGDPPTFKSEEYKTDYDAYRAALSGLKDVGVFFNTSQSAPQVDAHGMRIFNTNNADNQCVTGQVRKAAIEKFISTGETMLRKYGTRFRLENSNGVVLEYTTRNVEILTGQIQTLKNLVAEMNKGDDSASEVAQLALSPQEIKTAKCGAAEVASPSEGQSTPSTGSAASSEGVASTQQIVSLRTLDADTNIYRAALSNLERVGLSFDKTTKDYPNGVGYSCEFNSIDVEHTFDEAGLEEFNQTQAAKIGVTPEMRLESLKAFVIAGETFVGKYDSNSAFPVDRGNGSIEYMCPTNMGTVRVQVRLARELIAKIEQGENSNLIQLVQTQTFALYDESEIVSDVEDYKQSLDQMRAIGFQFNHENQDEASWALEFRFNEEVVPTYIYPQEQVAEDLETYLATPEERDRILTDFIAAAERLVEKYQEQYRIRTPIGFSIGPFSGEIRTLSSAAVFALDLRQVAREIALSAEALGQIEDGDQ